MCQDVNGAKIVCPYYQQIWKNRVCCEGGSRVSFPDKKSMDDYLGQYCAALPGWERCTMARARSRYYERT